MRWLPDGETESTVLVVKDEDRILHRFSSPEVSIIVSFNPSYSTGNGVAGDSLSDVFDDNDLIADPKLGGCLSEVCFGQQS